MREQLTRQVVLGILSEDLPAGHKLPSVRALARRHRIHSNTVSSAYHDLLEQGWLELRRGSGRDSAAFVELGPTHILPRRFSAAIRFEKRALLGWCGLLQRTAVQPSLW